MSEMHWKEAFPLYLGLLRLAGRRRWRLHGFPSRLMRNRRATEWRFAACRSDSPARRRRGRARAQALPGYPTLVPKFDLGTHLRSEVSLRRRGCPRVCCLATSLHPVTRVRVVMPLSAKLCFLEHPHGVVRGPTQKWAEQRSVRIIERSLAVLEVETLSRVLPVDGNRIPPRIKRNDAADHCAIRVAIAIRYHCANQCLLIVVEVLCG